MTRIIPTVSVRLRLLLPAALLAAGATLGGSAFGDPAIACAAPNDEWDLEHYDACVASYKGKKYDQGWDQHLIQCCFASGGVWSTKQGRCVAPSPNSEAQPTHPGVAPPPVEATQNPTPPPPPIRNPEITQTFTPAPAGPG
jgi:hypothetical protein